MLVRKDVFDRFGPLDARLQYSMDYEYWIRLTLAGAKLSGVQASRSQGDT